jgi:hypothetical protein
VETPRVVTGMLKRVYGPLMNANERGFAGGTFLCFKSSFISVYQRPGLFLRLSGQLQ